MSTNTAFATNHSNSPIEIHVIAGFGPQAPAAPRHARAFVRQAPAAPRQASTIAHQTPTCPRQASTIARHARTCSELSERSSDYSSTSHADLLEKVPFVDSLYTPGDNIAGIEFNLARSERIFARIICSALIAFTLAVAII